MQTLKLVGPPGTGKTTRLIEIVNRELDAGVPIERIAYLTHTNAARDEALDRIEKQHPGVRSKAKFFRTIHSAACFGAGITKSEIWGRRDYEGLAEATGYICRGSFDPEDLIDYEQGQDNTFDIVLHARSLASHRKVSLRETINEMADHPSLAPENVGRFLKAYSGYKESVGKKDFTDMLELIDDGFGGTLDVDVAIVDEAQDLSKRQWAVVHKMVDGCQRLYIAGDDDQAIYAFIGADEYGFLDHPADKTEVLHTSYRCARGIGATAENVIERIAKRIPKHVLWRDDVSHIDEWSQDNSYMPWEEWADGKQSVMVLCRHKKQVRDLRRLLYSRQVPHTVKGEAPNLTREALILKAYFEMKVYDRPVRGVDAAKVYDLFGLKQDAKVLREKVRRDRNMMVRRSDVSMWNFDWVDRVAKNGAQRRELDALRALLNKYDIEIIGRKPQIDISTYHASKGREADHVVLFTDVMRSVWDEQDLRPEGEIRLAYVGLTRARSNVTVVTPRTRQYLRALVERG
jgi:superfamily I DNA/RNA helicase